jgi:error-prone DNA polymerase
VRPSGSKQLDPFESVSDLARRAQLDHRHDLQVLAAPDALRSLAGNRREAL